jgi:hypothetical protein
MGGIMEGNQNKGCVVIFAGLAVCVMATMVSLALLLSGSNQEVRGGCFLNFGTGCNVYVTQTHTVAADALTSPLLIGALVVVIVLGGAFLLLTRTKGQ